MYYIRAPLSGTQMFITATSMEVFADMVQISQLHNVGGDKKNKQAYKLLRPYYDKQLPEALYLAAFFPYNPTSEKLILFPDQTHASLMRAASDKEYPPAVYRLGAYLDFGEDGILENKEEASRCFHLAAKLGHTHSKWIVACELIYGTEYVPKNIRDGMALLHEAANEKSIQALETLARYHKTGEFDFEKNEEISLAYQAMKSDPGAVDS